MNNKGVEGRLARGPRARPTDAVALRAVLAPSPSTTAAPADDRRRSRLEPSAVGRSTGRSSPLLPARPTRHGKAAVPTRISHHVLLFVANHPAWRGSRSFCQKLPSLATSKPIISLTAIIGALTEAFPVTTSLTAGARAASRSMLASLMANPSRCPRCPGSTTVSIWHACPGDPALMASSVQATSRPEAMCCATATRNRAPRATRRASFSPSLSASQISSSWPSSPWGSSVDMHRKSAHWSRGIPPATAPRT